MSHDEEAAMMWLRLDRGQRQRLTFRYTTAPFRDLLALGLFDIYGKRTPLGDRVAAHGRTR